MNYGIDSILRISGSAQDDKNVMREFLQFIERESERRLEVIDRLYNLNEILDSNSFLNAQDAMIGIRHMNDSIMRINEMHCEGALGSLTKKAVSKFLEILQEARMKFEYLQKIYLFDRMK